MTVEIRRFGRLLCRLNPIMRYNAAVVARHPSVRGWYVCSSITSGSVSGKGVQGDGHHHRRRHRVQAMLGAHPAPAERVLSRLPPRNGTVTVEKVAIKTVMDGCQPEEFLVPLVTSPDTLILVVAGGDGRHSSWCPPGRRRNGRSR
jgi:hypothetical protein